MDEAKVKTYLGFAIKAGKIIWGIDNILARKRFYPLILICNTASPRLLKQAEEYGKDKIPIMRVDNLAELLHADSCKAIAVNDKNLAEAIIKNLE